MPNGQTFSKSSDDPMLVGLSISISAVTSIRGRRRISESANSPENRRPIRASHAHRLETARPFGKTMRSRRNSPHGTINVMSQYPAHAAHVAPGNTSSAVRPTIA